GLGRRTARLRAPVGRRTHASVPGREAAGHGRVREPLPARGVAADGWKRDARGRGGGAPAPGVPAPPPAPRDRPGGLPGELSGRRRVMQAAHGVTPARAHGTTRTGRAARAGGSSARRVACQTETTRRSDPAPSPRGPQPPDALPAVSA